jgi:hypothetical protein
VLCAGSFTNVCERCGFSIRVARIESDAWFVREFRRSLVLY